MAKKHLTHINRLIVIGGSSGSLDALLLLVPLLDKDFAIPIIIVLHRSSNADNSLAELLAAKTILQIKEADEKDTLLAGWIYIAPPDYHLLVEDNGTLSLDASEKVNYCRPSIDVTFISAAEAYKTALTAVLLSGANADGANGMRTIEECGGCNIVQSPAEALVRYMPEQAILAAEIDYILAAADIAALLNSLSKKK